MPESKKPQIKLVELKVAIDNHTHHGKPCKKGDTIEVSPATKEMLEKVWAAAADKAAAEKVAESN